MELDMIVGKARQVIKLLGYLAQVLLTEILSLCSFYVDNMKCSDQHQGEVLPWGHLDERCEQHEGSQHRLAVTQCHASALRLLWSRSPTSLRSLRERLQQPEKSLSH